MEFVSYWDAQFDRCQERSRRDRGRERHSVRTLSGLGISSEHWGQAVRDYRRRFFSMVGSVHAIDVYCARTDRLRAKGSAWAGRVFRDCA